MGSIDQPAIQDVLVVGKSLDKYESQVHKVELDRMAVMLSRLGGRGYCVKDDSTTYGSTESDLDFDFDSDSDSDESKTTKKT